MKKHLLCVLTLAMLCVWAQPAVGVLTTDELILRHDYFTGSAADINPNPGLYGTRDGTVRSLSTLVAPVDDKPGYVFFRPLQHH